jgi:CheY-like chemotaxis protein
VSSLADINVLLVDDDDDGRDLLCEILSARGVQVVTASSAAQAFSMFQEARPDVIAASGRWRPSTAERLPRSR